MFDGSRNPLAYPAGRAAGFNPSHVAARRFGSKKGLSGVMLGGNVRDIFTGEVATQAGTITPKFNGLLGPVADYTLATRSTLSGRSTEATPATIAAIFVIPTIAGANHTVFASDSTAANGWLLSILAPGTLQFYNGAAALVSTMALTAGVPYFLVCSVTNGVAANFLAMDMRTGKIITETSGTGGAHRAPNGTYCVGNLGVTAGEPLKGTMAAISFTPSFLSMAEILQWAADPWSFWYPEMA